MSRIVRSFLLAAFAITSLFGQSTDASLTATISDGSGAVIPGVDVMIMNKRTGVSVKTITNDSGAFAFPTLPAGEYTLAAEKQGFRKLSLNDIRLEVGARVTLDLKLELGSNAEVVQVTADTDNPLTYATSSVSGVITEKKVLELPVSSRNVLNLTTTQAGTNGVNFNGARRGNLNIQIDGVNVMDARINQGITSMIFASVDRISEFRVVTQPVDAELGRGSGQVQMITRSGTNEFHGSLFNFHRNTVLNSNNWFNNLNNTPREILIRNQYGGRVGGPILKNRTFFHFLWEGQRIRRRDTVTSTVWTETARRGIYRYFPNVQNGNANATRPTVDINGNPVAPAAGATLAQVNLFNVDPQRAAMDPTGLVKRYIDAMPLPNDFRTGDGLNTAGYRWQRPYKFGENNFNVKIDHMITSLHRLSFSTSIERSNTVNDFMPQPYPTAGLDSSQQRDSLYQFTLTSTLRPTVINEFRGGALRPTYRFYSPWEVDPAILAKAGATPFGVDFGTITDPVNLGNDPQGRISPNYQFFNKTSILKGKHNYKFGGQLWFVSSNGFNSFDVLPRAVIGAGGVPVANMATAAPGIGQNLAGAQNILNDLNGSLTNLRQALNSPGGKDPSFLAGEVKQRTWAAPEGALFFQDDWKVAPSLTLNLGLRWELYGVPYDRNGKTAALAGGSQSIFGVSGTDWGAMFRPGATGGSLTNVNLVGPGSSNPNLPLYKSDRNNFSPAIGIAWSIPWLGAQKTVFRAGYSSAYERLSIRLLDVISGDQPGLRVVADSRRATKLDLTSATLPLASNAAPLSTVPLTDRTQTVRAYDTGLRTPLVHNFNAGITRALPRNSILTVNYVGSKGVRLLRGADVNEHNIWENGILEAFNITRNGGNAPLFDQMFRGLTIPGRGVVDGVNLTGSQVLRDINTTSQAYFASGSVGTLASYLSNTNYITGVNGGLLRNGLPTNLISANPQFASARLFSNLSSSSYHSLQVEVLTRTRDLTLQWNYTFAKALGDEDGDAQEQNDSFRTQRNRRLDKRLLASSAHHIMRSNLIYELPFGPGKSFASSNSWIRHLVGGWQFGSIFNIFSGDPLSVDTGIATFNAWTDNTPISYGKLDRHLGDVQRTGNGVVYFSGLTQTPDPSVATIGSQLVRDRSTLRAIRVGDANGQLLFSNPTPGMLGPMNQRSLYGPMAFRLDNNLIKTIKIRERINFQFDIRAENLTNSPQWANPNLDINSLNFGRITSAGGSRLVIIGGRLNF